MDNTRWDNYFLQICMVHAQQSKDPSTKVGAIIVGSDREIIASGFNGFPRGIADTPERLADRDTKLRLVVHAEINAVMNAARNGVRTMDRTMYLVATDSTGMHWGGAPCTRCTVELIQAGIREIVTMPFKNTPSRWSDDIAAARALLHEAGIHYREVQ